MNKQRIFNEQLICFSSYSRIFLTINGEGLQILTYARHS